MITFDINRLNDNFKEDYHIETNGDVLKTARELIDFFFNNSLSKFTSEEYSKFLDLCDIANCFYIKEVTQMKKRSYLTTRFDYDADFFVEVCEDYENVISFYLCRDDNGVKSHMFGLEKENAPVEKWEELIENNTAFHIDYYNKHYNE